MGGVVENREVGVVLDGSKSLVIGFLRLGLFRVGWRGLVLVGVVVLVVYFASERLGYGFDCLGETLDSKVRRFGIIGPRGAKFALLRRSGCVLCDERLELEWCVC